MQSVIDIASLIANFRRMASITIRNLDEDLKARLRVQAAQRGRSMEDEAREILRSALGEQRQKGRDLAKAIGRRFADFGGVELPVIERDEPRGWPGFEP
jgi:antitoxin FitA